MIHILNFLKIYHLLIFLCTGHSYRSCRTNRFDCRINEVNNTYNSTRLKKIFDFFCFSFKFIRLQAMMATYGIQTQTPHEVRVHQFECGKN